MDEESNQRRVSPNSFFDQIAEVRETADRALEFSEDNLKVIEETKTSLEGIKFAIEDLKQQVAEFDIEFVFLNIRAKSIGEDIKMTITCPDDKTTQVPVTVYVDEIKVIKPKDHKIDIVLDDKMTLRMKYPSLNQFVNNNFTVDDDPESVVDKTFQVVADCMDTVYTGEDAWDASDYSPSERMDFVNQLSSKQYKQVEKFFDTMPKLSHTIEVVNPNTKQKSSIVLEGLADFFG